MGMFICNMPVFSPDIRDSDLTVRCLTQENISEILLGEQGAVSRKSDKAELGEHKTTMRLAGARWRGRCSMVQGSRFLTDSSLKFIQFLFFKMY